MPGWLRQGTGHPGTSGRALGLAEMWIEYSASSASSWSVQLTARSLRTRRSPTRGYLKLALWAQTINGEGFALQR